MVISASGQQKGVGKERWRKQRERKDKVGMGKVRVTSDACKENKIHIPFMLGFITWF